MSNIKKWSSAAGSNNQASPDGFPENMAPSGVNDSAREVMAAVRRWYDDADWRDFDHTPSYATDASITLTGDQTSIYHTGRRVKVTWSGGTYYGTIDSSSFSANTRITVLLDSSASFTASLGALFVGFSFNNDSLPRDLFLLASEFIPDDLNDLSDVSSATPSDGQFLQWNSATAMWVPATVSTDISDLNDLSDVSSATPSDGQLLGWSSANAAWQATDPSTVPTNTFNLSDVSGTGSDGLYFVFSTNKWSPRALPTVPSDLNDLSDVLSTTPSTNQVLAWNGTAWAPATTTTGPSDLNDLSDVLSTTPSTNQVLAWNGTAWAPATTGGINNVVEDTTPQLGGMLDVNGNVIGDGTRTLLSFVEDGASVNFIQIENNATNNAPIIRATGSDTNVNLTISCKGSGTVLIGADVNLSDHTLSQVTLKDFSEILSSKGSASGSVGLSIAAGTVFTATMAGSSTFSFVNVPPGAASFTLVMTNGGGKTINWPASVRWTNGTAPTLTTSGIDVLTFISPDAGTTWYGFLSGVSMS